MSIFDGVDPKNMVKVVMGAELGLNSFTEIQAQSANLDKILDWGTNQGAQNIGDVVHMVKEYATVEGGPRSGAELVQNAAVHAQLQSEKP